MRGFTLIELLVALAVGGVLLTWATVNGGHLILERRASAALNQALGAVQFTRHAAVTHRATASLCPSASGGCGLRDTWHEGALIFLDRNGDGRLDGEDVPLRRLPSLAADDRIYWRSFRNRRHLSFLPSGLTDWQSGNFTYCPPTATCATHGRPSSTPKAAPGWRGTPMATASGKTPADAICGALEARWVATASAGGHRVPQLGGQGPALAARPGRGLP